MWEVGFERGEVLDFSNILAFLIPCSRPFLVYVVQKGSHRERPRIRGLYLWVGCAWIFKMFCILELASWPSFRPFFVCVVHKEELWEEASDLRPLICIGLCLKNQNVVFTLDCSRPCFVLFMAYIGAWRRGFCMWGYTWKIKMLSIYEWEQTR